MASIDFGSWDIAELETVIGALRPGETLEEFILKAALERYDRRKVSNVIPFKPKQKLKILR
jgi:hypothetical protein